MTSANVTVNHEKIRQWAEARGGHPAWARHEGPSSHSEDGLRIGFPDPEGERSLEPISWEEWFSTFEANRLAFLYQEEVQIGRTSRFNKVVPRDDNKPNR